MTLICISLHFIVFKPLKNSTSYFLQKFNNERNIVSCNILSSAKLAISNFSIKKKGSYKWILKKSGPNTEPCGKLDIISFQELYSLPILVLWKRCDKQSFTKLSELLSKPEVSSFAINKECGWQSKALVRTINNAPKAFPRSTLCFHFSNSASKQC